MYFVMKSMCTELKMKQRQFTKVLLKFDTSEDEEEEEEEFDANSENFAFVRS